MSAIAYITDPNMLEFHRLHANQTMVFWRFSMRKFSRFHQGDLVFFIDSQSRHPQTGEKGLIGYGRCTEIKNKSPKTTWDQHQYETGYASYEDFTEAIRHYRKNDHRLPQTLQVIKLDKIHFFQSPVFLSEVGIDMSPRLESFTYIEKDGQDMSSKLLEIAQELGLDQWTLSQNEKINESSLVLDHQEQIYRNILSTIDVTYTEQQLRLIKNHTKSVVVHNIFYKFDKLGLYVYYPIVRESQINAMLGVKAICDKKLDHYHFRMLHDLNLSSKSRDLLSLLNVMHEQI